MKKYKPIKVSINPGYSWLFNRDSGLFIRWGKDMDDDPDFSPLGPEIMDIEISTICHGGCSHCYKSNTGKGRNMSYKTFKKMFDKFPENLTQIAFGIGDIDGNPDLWKIMKYCRKNGVIPNITINGFRFNKKHAEKLAKICGAVAVSHYHDDACFNTIKMLRDAGLEQVNIHKMLSQETFYSTLDLFDSFIYDSRLEGLNAIVLLGVKQKGRGEIFTPLPGDMFQEVVDAGFRKKIPLGFDSCSAHKFIMSITGHPRMSEMLKLVEPCESCCFSFYINVDGQGFPCSFLEGEEGYDPIDVLNAENFMEDVWKHPWTKQFRAILLNIGRKCPRYDI